MVQHCQDTSGSEQWYSTDEGISRSEQWYSIVRISAGMNSGTALDRPGRYSIVRISAGVNSGTALSVHQQE